MVWIYNHNYLFWKEDIEKFDIVVGNPPYVRIQHLEESRRNKIYKSNWKMVSGCSDLFIIFFEIGLHLLQRQGRAGLYHS